MKDQQAWQLEQGRELSTLKEKVDVMQETGVANHILDGQTAMGLASLDRRVNLLEKQGRFLLDWQEQDSNVWHNVAFNLREEVWCQGTWHWGDYPVRPRGNPQPKGVLLLIYFNAY